MAVSKTFIGTMLAVGLCTAIAVGQTASPRAGRLGPGQTATKKPSAAKPTPGNEPLTQPSAQPPAPVVPLRPSQMPAVAPRVSYHNGALTVVAENSTMADVIAQVRAATGVKIETVGGPSGERIAVRIGPAPVRDVILSLVQGSQYDFIILGVSGQPNAVERVILTPKVAGGSVASAASPPPRFSGNAIYQAPPQEVSEDDGNEGFAPPPPPQNQAQPTPVDPNAPARTPEQLLEELRRMEEQRNNPQGRPQRPPR
jgi:hypothetical protein